VRRLLASLLASALFGGCASLVAPTPPASAGAELSACSHWFGRLDTAVDHAGVRDAEADRIDGFAGLRVDRLSASLRDHARVDGAAFDAWLARLQRLEGEGRAVEIGNLPRGAFPIGDVADAATAQTRTQTCTEAWRGPLQRDPALRAALLTRAEVPDRYATWQRAIGLYPILRWPFHAGVQGWERDHGMQVAHWVASPPPTQRYVPAALSAPGGATANLWRQRPRDALGLPQFTAAETAALLAAHAPALEIESRGEYDRFGALAWRESATPAVSTDEPVVYQRVAFTRYRGQVLLQLVYSLWFPERPARSSFDLLAGALDAVVLRITLAPDDGRPLLVDSIHGCGCYHLFMPTSEVRLRENPPTDIEWAYAPITLPALRAAERLVVRISSASHDVVGLALDSGASGTPYALRDEDSLRSLPRPGGGTRSVYGPNALIAGTERSERYLYWPMGIASAGAMRQWGHHATAFVGRRHFDDADLIERRFLIPALE
jgi:hypothetical protein